MASMEKVIVLVDIDCFYCQVEEKFNPELRNKPAAVVQFNTWREGGIIAANYLARAKGVTKGLWCYEAKEKCPEILFATVSQIRGRADLTKYREAGKEVANVLQAFTALIERASVDEAYLDITEEVNKRMRDCTEPISVEKLPNTHVVGYEISDFLDNITNSGEFSEESCRLAIGAVIAEEIRAEVLEKTGYRCSAGIAHNKILAKLACGIKKPNAQTILPQESVIDFYRDLPLEKIKSLGGKFGKSISEELQISNMGQLIKFTEKELIQKFEEKTGKWLYNIARGVDLEPVRPRLIPKSISCCKRFPGKNCLVSPGSVEKWVNELAIEIAERLEKDMEENNRRAKQIVVSFSQSIGEKNISSSRTTPLNSYDQAKIGQDCLNIIKKFCSKSDGTYNNITYLGLSAGNFQNIKNNSNIKSFFQNPAGKLKIIDKSTDESMNSHPDNNEIYLNEQSNSSSDNLKKNNCIPDNNSTVFDETEALEEIREDDKYPLAIEVNEFVGIANVETSTESFFNEYFKNNSGNSSCSKNTVYNENANETVGDTSSLVDDKQKLHSDKSFCEEDSNFESRDEILHGNEKEVIQGTTSHLDHQEASSSKKTELCCPNSEETDSKRLSSQRVQREVKSGVKRKACQMKPILTFLKNEDLNEDNSEYCPECKKRIKVEDIIFHNDYHTARQLHHQLNYSEVKKQSEPSTKKSRSSKHKSNKTKTNGSILKFFNIDIP